MKKSILLLIAAMFLSLGALNAQINVEIGTGIVTKGNIPVNALYKYSYCQQIYTAAQIGYSGTITSISYHKATGTEDVRLIKVYMAHTSKVKFSSSSDWVAITSENLVYDGNCTLPEGDNWVTITLDVPFPYNGTDNLMIAIDDNTNYVPALAEQNFYSTSMEWGNDRVIYAMSDEVNIDPLEIGSFTGSKYSDYYISNIKMTMETVPYPVITINPEQITMGYRPNGCWMRPVEVTITNTGHTANLYSVESSNPFFGINGVILPQQIGFEQVVPFQVSTGSTAAGEVEGCVVVTYNSTKDMQMLTTTATVYDPVSPDVWEMAREVENPVNYTDTPENLYDNYLLPGSKQDGKDAVYKVTFNDDVMLDANVTNGTNSKIAIYKEDFGGQGGPSVDNAYTGSVPTNGNRAVINVLEEGFEGGVIPEGWTQVHENFETDWVVQTGLKPTFVPTAHSGQYNAMFNGSKNRTTTKLITPVMDLSAGIDATLTFWHAQKYDRLRIYYRTSPDAEWVQLVAYNSTVSKWTMRQIALPNLTSTYQIAFEGYDSVGDNIGVDDIVVTVDTQIDDMSVAAGTYYIVASSTTDNFNININAQTIPVPTIASNPFPADGTIDVTTPIEMTWNIGNYTTEYRVMLGTTYPPTDVLVDWTTDVAESHVVASLTNSTNYYWRVDERNSSGETQGNVWGFTTTLAVPENLAVANTNLFFGENAVLSWNEISIQSLAGYNIYQNGVKINETPIANNSFTVENLAYNMNGYTFNVTGVFTQGESSMSENVTVFVSGNGTVSGRIIEEDGTTGIAGATVSLDGTNEYFEQKTMTVVSEADGTYEFEVNAGTYNATVSKFGYISTSYSVELDVTYDTVISDINMVMEKYYAGVDLYVSPTGFAMWNLNDEENDSVVYYRILLDGVLAGSTGDTIFQFDVEDLVEGTEHTASVAAVYLSGISEYTDYEWTYSSCENFEGVTSFSVTNVNGNAVLNWTFPEEENDGRDAWDFVKSFQTLSGGEQGVACDGNYIYTSTWSSSYPGYSFGKYTLDGEFVETFSFNNVQGIRDLTYDGTYFYGGCCTSTLYVMDFVNKNLVNTITLQGATIRHCSYDPVYDGFWVGDYQNLKLYSRAGELLITAPSPLYTYGSAYYMDNVGQSHIYLFDQAYQGVELYDYNITTNTMGTEPIFDFSVTPGYVQSFGGGLAGGAFIGEYNGMTCFFGNSQQEPDLIGIYELDAQQPVPGGVIGAMIWKKGELLTPVPTVATSYIDFAPGTGSYEYCVRLVYGGSHDLTYYAMSCNECEEIVFEIPCNAPKNLYAELTSEGVELTWPYNGGGEGDWIYYDNGDFADAVGVGIASPVYWGIKFTSSQLAQYDGMKLTQVALYDHTPGSYTANIYKGGESSPKTLLFTQTWNLSGSDTYQELPLSQAVDIDGNENLWVTFYTSDIAFPASACQNTGDENGRWVSFDGTTWTDITSYGSSFDFTWMVRAFIMETNSLRDAFQHYNVYRGTDFDNMEIIAATITGFYLDNEISNEVYYYQVTAYYEEAGQQCESNPANSFLNPDENYVMIDITDVVENKAFSIDVYPNPVKDVLKITANEIYNIRIFNSLGQQVYNQSMCCNEITIDMNKYEQGIYLVHVVTANGTDVVRVIVNK